MTDKEKIRAEIERRYNERDRVGDNIRANVHKSLISFIDSMQEEPVSIDFEQELYKAFGQVKDFTLGMRIAKRFYDMGKKSRETVSEGLEGAAFDYAEACKYEGVEKLLCVEHFKAGAEWQKEKDESITEDLGEYINELSKQFPEVSFAKLSRIAVRVAKWQKEKMMARAVDAKLLEGHLIKQKGVTHPLHIGDKVKVIVIKED